MGPLGQTVRKGDYFYVANMDGTISVKLCKTEKRIETKSPVYLYVESARNRLFVIGGSEISIFDIQNPANPVLLRTDPTSIKMIGKAYIDIQGIIHIEDKKGPEWTVNTRKAVLEEARQ